MPFIECTTSKALSAEVRERVKARFGQAVSALKKPESYLMVGFREEELWFAGKRCEAGAYVSVSLFGRAAPADYERMTALVCDILQQEAGISPAQTYVTYHPVEDWGWNGANF